MRSAISRLMATAAIRAPQDQAGTDPVVAAYEVAIEILGQPSFSPATAFRALDRLRRRVDASQAAVWIVTEVTATCVLQAGGGVPKMTASTVDLADREIVIERLRRHGTLRCRAGEISGVEELVPEGVGSFVAAAGPSPDSSFTVLVLGWDAPQPPYGDATSDAHFRTVAGLLHRILTDRAGNRQTQPDAILGSLADRIAVVDPDGTIRAANAAWTAFARLQDDEFARSIAVGANYFVACQRAVAGGFPDLASVRQGVEAVARGERSFFHTAYSWDSLGEEQWYVVTATPLRGQPAGAVVAHSVVTPEIVRALVRKFGERLFRRLVDTIPLPISIVTPEGRFAYGNQRWIELAAENRGNGAESRSWIDAFHPDDRTHATAAFRGAVARRENFDLEVRVQASDGTYRWMACLGAPHFALNGQVEGYVVVSCDISAKRRAEWSLSEVASKLLAAQEDERRRIGRELHDDLGQQAALLAAKLETLARNSRLSRNSLRAGVVEAEENLQDLAVAIHSLSHELHPAKLKLLGLVTTLEALARDVSKESNVRVGFRSQDIPSDIPEPIALCVFRVTQEALQNAVKHSGAHRIELQLTGTPSQLRLLVTDSGRGFDPLKIQANGIGLLTMRERVELNGGKLRIDTTHPHGTTIEAVLPLDEPGRAV